MDVSPVMRMTSAILISQLKGKVFINYLNLEAIKDLSKSISGWCVSPNATFRQETLKKKLESKRIAGLITSCNCQIF